MTVVTVEENSYLCNTNPIKQKVTTKNGWIEKITLTALEYLKTEAVIKIKSLRKLQKHLKKPTIL